MLSVFFMQSNEIIVGVVNIIDTVFYRFYNNDNTEWCENLETRYLL